MKHYIIIQYNDLAQDRARLLEEISELFSRAERIEGIHSVTVHPAVLCGPSRHDLMIVMDMEKEALAVFDAGPIHKQWKENFAKYIAHKTIFDCE